MANKPTAKQLAARKAFAAKYGGKATAKKGTSVAKSSTKKKGGKSSSRKTAKIVRSARRKLTDGSLRPANLAIVGGTALVTHAFMNDVVEKLPFVKDQTGWGRIASKAGLGFAAAWVAVKVLKQRKVGLGLALGSIVRVGVDSINNMRASSGATPARAQLAGMDESGYLPEGMGNVADYATGQSIYSA